MSIFLILNLAFAISSQITTSTSVFASSNNSEDQPNPEESMDDNSIPLEVDEGQELQPSENTNDLNDSSSNDNNIDANIGLFDSGSIDKNILRGKDVSSSSIDAAHLTVRSGGETHVSKHFGPSVTSQLSKTVSVCVETVAAEGKTVFAFPHCSSGLYMNQKFTVEPGQIKIDVKNSPQLAVHYKFCDINYLGPMESKECLLVFLPSPRAVDITPKPNSDFGKSMIGP